MSATTTVLPLDYPDRPTRAEAARDDVAQPPAGACTVSREVDGRVQSCARSAGHLAVGLPHLPWRPEYDPFHDYDPGQPYDAQTGSAHVGITVAAALGLGLWLLAGGIMLHHLDQQCHAQANTATGHELCQELTR